MTRTLVLAALLLTAACNQQDRAPAPTNDVAAASAAPVAKAEVPLLKGEWRVAGGAGLTATFSATQAILADGCLRRAWTYTQNRNTVAFTSAPGGSANCGRSPSAAQEGVYSALQDANMAVFTADGGAVTLSGLGGNVQLERR